MAKLYYRARTEDDRSGRALATAGEQGGRFYLILEGNAQVTIAGEQWAELGPGEYFGEISLIDGEPRSASVTAASDLRVLSLASFTFAPLLVEHPTITRKILLEMCARLRRAEEANGSRPAEA